MATKIHLPEYPGELFSSCFSDEALICCYCLCRSLLLFSSSVLNAFQSQFAYIIFLAFRILFYIVAREIFRLL